MNVALVVPAYNQAAALVELIDSAADSAHELCVFLYLHSTDPATTSACETLARRGDVRYRPYGVNRGVSRTWNDGILAGYGEGADVVVVANDDIRFSTGDLDRIAGRAARCRDRHVVTCAGPHGRLGGRLASHGYACFAVNPIALETIGCFDENFFPAYCEDQDYARRAGLAGLVEERCLDTTVLHHGSSAIHASPELHRRNQATQRLNLEYYVRKWGGPADGGERFATPFDNPGFTLRIAPEERAAPYGSGYDRTDR